MTISLDLLQFLTLVGAMLGALAGLARLLVGQFEKRLDGRFQVLEEQRVQGGDRWQSSFSALETTAHHTEQRLTQLLIDLPLYYQRREDAVRAEVGIIHRLDALAIKVDDALRCDVRSCPLRHHPETADHRELLPHVRSAV